MSDDVCKAVLRELSQINRKSVFDDNATIEPEEDNCLRLKVTLTPQTGLFANTAIPFTFEIPADYPSAPPFPACQKVIYHSNISDDGSVCLNMFSEPDPSYRIEHYVNGLLWLLDNQNFDSQLNGSVTPNRRLFKANFKLACMGYHVGGLPLDDIYVKKPDLAEKRKIMRELLDFLACFPRPPKPLKQKKVVKKKEEAPEKEEEVAKKEEKKEEEKKEEENKEKVEEKKEEKKEEKIRYIERPASAVLHSLTSRSEPAHYDFMRDQLPFLHEIPHSEAFSFLWQQGTSTRASELSRRLDLKEDSIVRPVVIEKGDQLALILTFGPERVDTVALSALFNENVSIPNAAQLKQKDPGLIDRLPMGFNHQEVFVDQSILSSEPFHLQTQFPNLILKAPGNDLFSFFEKVWPNTKTMGIPRDPPRKEKVVVLAPSSEEEEKVEEKKEEGKVEEKKEEGKVEEKKEEEKVEEKKEEERKDEKKEEEKKDEKKEKEKEREKITCRTASAPEEAFEALPVVGPF